VTVDLHDAHAVETAVDFARAHGATVREPAVLHDGANVVVHLRPAPVVARVASTTAVVRHDPAAFLARDVALASYAAANGASVVPPSTEVPAGPVVHRGRVLTCFEYVPNTGREAEPDELGRALAELHAVLTGFEGELPYLGPVLGELHDVAMFLGSYDAMRADEVARVLEGIDACAAALPPPSGRALHGDAHRRNVLVTERGIVWNDFEDSCRGDVAWDLACLGRRSGPRAIAAYGDDRPTDAELEPYVVARTLQAEVWERVFEARDAGRLPIAALGRAAGAG
jgi:Ser/Thr protein kinase RdoA (MazF antagonist)